MKKRFLITAIIILIIVFTSLAVYFDTTKIEKVCFENNCFNVEIADNITGREYGLMNRTFLDQDAGMLFIFEEQGIHDFWMKDTLIPLDIIWISEDKEVVTIKENFEPCIEEKCLTIIPYKKSLYVLEINAGLVKEFGIKTGDKVRF